MSRGAVELLGGKVQPGVTVSKVRSKVQSYVSSVPSRNPLHSDPNKAVQSTDMLNFQ